MRRPTFCNNSVAVEPPRPSDKDEGRLTRVKRILTSSLRKPVVNKVFAVHIDELPVNNEHVPKVYSKMANYIETYGLTVEGLFRLSGGNPTLVEQLKASFNRQGDVDLEACSDVSSVASLLKLWLRDLPHPLVSPAITAELVTLMHKYREETEWSAVARDALDELPPRHGATLRRTLALLHGYASRQPASAAPLPAVFAPLLLCADFHGISTPDTVLVTDRLIRLYPFIYAYSDGEVKLSEGKQRKRKERHNSDATSLDRKFVRSSSEERPSVEEKSDPSESIRRVSSHEDFSHTRTRNNTRNHTHTHAHQHQRRNQEPLHEHNGSTQTRNPHSHSHTHTHKNQNQNSGSDLSDLVEPSPSPGYASDLFDENEHERRRHSERHAPHVSATRRRRKSGGRLTPRQYSSDESSKENEDQSRTPEPEPQTPTSDVDECPSPDIVSQTSEKSVANEGPEEPGPVLDLTTLHQQVDSSEPLPSYTVRNPEAGEEQLVSVVMSRRLSAPDDAPQRTQLSRQIHNLKRKLKRFEEGFEKDFGYRPSLSDKMSDPETKKLCSLLTKLRKQLSSLKEEGSSVLENVMNSKDVSENKLKPLSSKEDAILDIEKRLSEKRLASGRPELVEEMTFEQLVAEKLAVQKGLLMLENTFGRPATREAREAVRPLYDRYRNLKRLLARNAPSKLKDSGTELGTILEHETMDFTWTSPPPSREQPSSPPPPPDPELDNLHALPVSELIKQQQSTREEKKRLRRNLREFEEELQKAVGRKLSRDDRIPMEQTYTEYKHAKAKLRLLDALLMKKQ